MVKEKGLAPEAADKIGEYVKLKGGEELVEQLSQDVTLYENKAAKAGIDSIRLLLQYINLFGIRDKVSIMPLYPCLDSGEYDSSWLSFGGDQYAGVATGSQRVLDDHKTTILGYCFKATLQLQLATFPCPGVNSINVYKCLLQFVP